MNVAFERPALLVLGLIVFFLSLALLRLFRGYLAVELSLGPPGGVHFKAPLGVDLSVRIIRMLELAGAFLLILAAAGPVSLRTQTVWLDRGADILFVIDVSPSMSGIDMGGKNRFDAARALVREFSAARPTDSIGLIAVGADAALLVPPTIDRGVLVDRLDQLTIAELGDGTALGTGLAVAALHLRSSRALRKAVVLITDGENNAGAVHPVSAAETLRSLGCSLWVVGVGTNGEVPIDYVDPQTKIRRTGSFDSRFDPESLRAVARAGGGSYLAAPSAQSLGEAFSQVDSAEATVRRSRTLRSSIPRDGPLIAIGVALLVLARGLRRIVLGALL